MVRMYKVRRISIASSEEEQHEEGACHEENADGKYGIAHTTGDGFNDAETEGARHGGKFFHHIIETEEGSMIGGIRQHLRIG